MKKWISRTTLAIATAVVAALVLEGGARLWVAIANPPPRDYYAFMESRPAPYRDSGFYSREFVDEYLDGARVFTPPGTTLLIPVDRSGRFINVEGGRRATAYRPRRVRRTLYLFGGSTVFGTEVPDENTVASRLQYHLNRARAAVRVENLGVVAATAGQQLERLETLDLRPGDTVVFYDGVNEIYQGLYLLHPDGWTADQLGRSPSDLPAHRRVALEVYERLYHRSYLVTWFMDPYDTRSVPDHLRDPEHRRRLVRQIAADYETTLREAHEYCTDRGVSFFHFLQPNLFSVASRSAYEERLLASRHFTPAGLDVAFAEGYAELRKVVRRLAATGVVSHDLTKLLDQRSDGTEFFFDFCHVNHVANDRIAARLAATVLYLLELGPERDSLTLRESHSERPVALTVGEKASDRKLDGRARQVRIAQVRFVRDRAH